MLLHRGSHIPLIVINEKDYVLHRMWGCGERSGSIFRLSIRGYLGKGGGEEREGEKA